MDKGVYDSFDECEPRSGLGPPVKAERINITMVPEVSLILDKHENLKKSNNYRELPHTPSQESYATWKKNKFPDQEPPVARSPLSVRKEQHEMRHAPFDQTQTTSKYQPELNGHRPHKSPSPAGTGDRRFYREHDSSSRNEHIQQPSSYKTHREPSNSHDTDLNYKKSVQTPRPKNYHKQKSEEVYYNQNGYTQSSAIQPYRASCQSPQQTQHNYDSGYHNSMQKSSSHGNYSIDHEYHSRSPHRGHSQPEHSRSEHPSYCSSHYNNSNSEQSETIKNLLQLINSQNEQIRNLQNQMERLLKIHEDNMQKRNQCTCQLYANLPIQNIASEARQVQCMTQRNEHLQPPMLAATEELNQDEIKQTILEQKVSIGVMTSFEFNVQNNPSFVLDQDKRQINYEKDKIASDCGNNVMSSSIDAPRKKSTLYTPSALENISEGSESRHHSSNCTNSTRPSLDCTEGPRQLSNSVNPQVGSPPSNPRLQNRISRTELIQQKNVDSVSNQQRSNSYDRTSPHLKKLKNPDYEEVNQEYKDTNENLLENHAFTNKRYQQNSRNSALREQPKDVLDNDDAYQKKYNARNSVDVERTVDGPYKPWKQDVGARGNSRNGRYRYEESLILSDDLEIDKRSSPSPEPSIHVDMQEYSSEEGSVRVKQTPQIGWTFYKNVLGQVNQILQNSPINENKTTKDPKDSKVPMDQVKAATMEELTKMGISFIDNTDPKEANPRKVMFDATSYSRLNPEVNLGGQGIMAETNTSLHMKALALKYLNDEQLSDFAVQKQRSGGMKQLMMSNVQNTNMSFATMHYLQRYQLLPGKVPTNSTEFEKENFPAISEIPSPKPTDQRANQGYHGFTPNPRGNYSNKILDITALKQQPKLL